MNSSRSETRNNLAATLGPTKLLVALKDLANMRDESASFKRFARHWPSFIHLLDDDPPDNYVGFDYGEPVTRMPPNLPRRFLPMWQAREALREIWRGNSGKLTDVLLPSLSDVIADPDPEGLWPPQLKMDWHRGEFVYVPRSKLQDAVYQLFRRSRLVKVCANRDCPAPYFIAGKTAQRYCSDACAQIFQRAYKLRWWKEHGSDWRRCKARRKLRRKERKH
jgi:hypothetical protein